MSWGTDVVRLDAVDRMLAELHELICAQRERETPPRAEVIVLEAYRTARREKPR